MVHGDCQVDIVLEAKYSHINDLVSYLVLHEVAEVVEDT